MSTLPRTFQVLCTSDSVKCRTIYKKCECCVVCVRIRFGMSPGGYRGVCGDLETESCPIHFIRVHKIDYA